MKDHHHIGSQDQNCIEAIVQHPRLGFAVLEFNPHHRPTLLPQNLRLANDQWHRYFPDSRVTKPTKEASGLQLPFSEEGLDWPSILDALTRGTTSETVHWKSKQSARCFEFLVWVHQNAFLVIQCDDVTEQQAERETTLALAAAAEHSRDLIMVFDEAGCLRSGNRTLAKMAGVAQVQDLLGQQEPTFLFPDPERKEVTESQVPEHELVKGREEQQLFINGQWRTYFVRSFPIQDERGKKIGMGKMATDITHRKEMETKLVQSGKLLAKLANQIPGVIYQYQLFPDGHSCFPFASPHIWSIYEVTPEEVRLDASSVFARLHPDDLNRVSERIQASFEELCLWEDDYRVILPSRGMRWLRGVASPERLGDGSVLWHGYITDITERKEIEQALEFERDLFSAGPVFTIEWALSPGWPIRHVSANVLDCLGFERNELEQPGFCFHELIHPEDRERVTREVQTFLAENRLRFTQSYRVKTRHLGYRWFFDATMVLRDEHGQPLLLRGYMYDQTEQQEIEDALQKATSRLTMAAKAGGVGIWEYDLRAGRLIWDDMMFQLYGLSPEQFTGTLEDWVRGVHSEDRQAGEEAVRLALSGEKEFDTVFRICTPAGEVRTLRGLATVERDTQGQPLRMIGTNWDISKDVENERIIKESEEKFRQISENVGEVFWLRSADNQELLYINPAYEKVWGRPRRELYENPTSFMENVFPEDRPMVARAYQAYMTSGVFDEEYRIIRPDGSLRWVQVRTFPVFDEGGTLIRHTGLAVDMTDRKQILFDLEKAKSVAEEANRSKSQFLANMSHEIRTPLNAVIGFTDLLQSTLLTPIQQEYVRNANTAGHVLMGIINDVLDFSKIEAGMMDLEWVETEMRPMLEAALDLIVLPAHQKGLNVLLDLCESIPQWAVLDPTRIKQVLVNLLNNAVKFTEKGDIRLSVDYQAEGQGKGRFSFAVHDTGIGMTESQVKRLFQPFAQADASTTRKYGGTGLGLIISQLIVKQHGGTIDVASEAGVGSCFSFTLSLTCHDRKREQVSTPLALSRVLLIDDHDGQRLLLDRLLRHWGLDVLHASTLDEALTALARQPVDVVFCDDSLQDISGFEVICQLRNPSDLFDPPKAMVLMHTALEDEAVVRQCEDFGVALRLMKPIKQRRLHALLKQLGLPHDAGCFPMDSTMTACACASREGALSVLVAEDVEVNWILVQAMIRKTFPQAEVLRACHGEEAVRLATQLHFDLILMDVQMPEMDGLEATRRIRSWEGTNTHVPIIALTAGALREERQGCLAAGMDDFLTKPIDPSYLAQVLLRYAPKCEEKRSGG